MAFSQQIVFDSIAFLPNPVFETSGLIFLNDKLITHNDSGNEPALFELDTVSGEITRKVIIRNATNVDWEDICYDDTYIYIGDFGNNSGSRTDLKIYRISITNYFDAANDTVSADTIHFNYGDQSDFTPGSNQTNFDAEALISLGDSLYIFTKNWLDFKTNIYSLSKLPGTYSLVRVDSLNPQGLITGACTNKISGSVRLSGYTLSSAFVVELSLFSDARFSSGTIEKINLPVLAQIEAITNRVNDLYYLSSEKSIFSESILYRLRNGTGTDIGKISTSSIKIFPNPSSEYIFLSTEQAVQVELYDVSGNFIWKKQVHRIPVSDLKTGIFFLNIKTLDGEFICSHKIVVN